MATHNDMGAVNATKFGQGSDLDAAVLAAANMNTMSPSQRLSLAFSCENLPNMDTFSKSDPFLILYKQSGNQWLKLGRTEVIHDNLSPVWVTQITAEYHFEQQERFKLEVYDVDNEEQVENRATPEFCGRFEFQLHEVVTCIDQKLTRPLVNQPKQAKATVTIIAEEVTQNSNSEIVIFSPEAKLKETGGLYFFMVLKQVAPGQYTPCYKSEVRKPTGDTMKWNQV